MKEKQDKGPVVSTPEPLTSFTCPCCAFEIPIPADVKNGDVIVCPNVGVCGYRGEYRSVEVTLTPEADA